MIYVPMVCYKLTENVSSAEDLGCLDTNIKIQIITTAKTLITLNNQGSACSNSVSNPVISPEKIKATQTKT